MALRKIEIPKTEFTFSDGQTVELKAPTLALIQSVQNKTKDEIEQAKLMLIEMSDGERVFKLPADERMERAIKKS